MKWQDRPAEWRTYFGREGNIIYWDTHTDGEAPERIQELLITYAPRDRLFALVFDLRCSGYHWPATWQSPEEGEDCRELDEAYLMVGEERIDLPKNVQTELFAHFEVDIYQATLDIDED